MSVRSTHRSIDGSPKGITISLIWVLYPPTPDHHPFAGGHIPPGGYPLRGPPPGTPRRGIVRILYKLYLIWVL